MAGALLKGLLDRLWLFMSIISLSPMKSHLPNPSVACGISVFSFYFLLLVFIFSLACDISEFAKARGKQPVKEFRNPLS